MRFGGAARVIAFGHRRQAAVRAWKALYRLRARVEHLINRLKQFRRIATRYEKRAENYLRLGHNSWP